MDDFENKDRIEKVLHDDDLDSVAGGREEGSKSGSFVYKIRSTDESGKTPKYAAGARIIYSGLEAETFPGIIVSVGEKTGWIYEEFEYTIKLDLGYSGICWEHQLMLE